MHTARILQIVPHLWPSRYPDLQFIAWSCLLILVLGRIVNAFLPLTLGALITTFTTSSIAPFSLFGSSPWPYLITYALFRFLASSGGLTAIREALYIPLMQYSDRSISMLLFNRVLALSLSCHTKPKAAELLRILDRGNAINRLGELIGFTVIPALLDIWIALLVFVVKFELALALVVVVVIGSYIWASVVLMKYRTWIRRRMDERGVITRGIHTDCVLNYETVKYFGGEEYETKRYAEVIGEYQSAEKRAILSLNFMNIVQTLIITSGLLVGSLIVASRITTGRSNTGDFVVFITYYAHLCLPLSTLVSVYRAINQSLVETEKLLDILDEPTEVVDEPDAKELVISNGEVEFDNVSFSYDNKTPVLHNVSFKVPRGGRVALVGESGAGKSTILRLLYRFYDLRPGSGRILIDGQDIRTVTLSSLRSAIGVVPQDPVLFNASIRYNIAYGQQSTTPPDESTIILSTQAVQMHDRIMSFPDGYETKVGEKGVRLNGGEKQQVAIARTLVKNPRVLLLDEATSALDSATERRVLEGALGKVVDGRSCLSIAHRLSMTKGADLIMVLKDGRIVEKGSHKELLELNGLFASMWANQISTSGDPKAQAGDDDVDDDAPVVDVPESETRSTAVEVQVVADSPKVVPAFVEAKPDVPKTFPTDDNATQAFPTKASMADTPRVPALPAFPTKASMSHKPSIQAPPASPTKASESDAPSIRSHPEVPSVPVHVQGASVTFDAKVPKRPRTADSESSPRKVLSIHNIQRLAKISLTGRPPKSPGLPHRDPSMRDASMASSVSVTGTVGGGAFIPPTTWESMDEPQLRAFKKKEEKKRKKRKSFI